jgi:TPR repeat protein
MPHTTAFYTGQNPLYPPCTDQGINLVRTFIAAGLSALTLTAASVAVPMAGPLEDAVAANKAGDYATAMSLLRPLAEQGDANAQYGVGALYWNGHGVTADAIEALKWFRLAAAQKHAEAQLDIGFIYSGVEGVTKDEKEAAKWFHLAAEAGLAEAQYILGVVYDGGQGVTMNEATAVKWFQRAAVQGNAQAQFSLATMYATGSGIKQDRLRAQMWFTLGAKHGANDPERWQEMWTKSLTTNQIMTAQVMSEHCEDSAYKEC